jgi:AraC-like DNA-binding protein
MRCVVPLLDQQSHRRVVAVPDQDSAATAQAFDWPGILMEVGTNDVAEVDDLTLAHHYVGLNTGRRPITLEVKEQQGYRRVTLAPGTGWLSPAGQSFSLRVRGATSHACTRVSIDPARFEQLVGARAAGGGPATLHRTYEIGGSPILHLMRALAAEARAGTPSGLAFVDALMRALGLQLVQQAGGPVRRMERSRGGLAPGVRRRILERMEAQPDARLTVDELARDAGLSPGHFAHAFKRSVGRAPHQHLLALRLEAARRLLDAPDAVLSDVAWRTGFADQAHFSRFFKRQFGISPGTVLRSRRGT